MSKLYSELSQGCRNLYSTLSQRALISITKPLSVHVLWSASPGHCQCMCFDQHHQATVSACALISITRPLSGHVLWSASPGHCQCGFPSSDCRFWINTNGLLLIEMVREDNSLWKYQPTVTGLLSNTQPFQDNVYGVVYSPCHIPPPPAPAPTWSNTTQLLGRCDSPVASSWTLGLGVVGPAEHVESRSVVLVGSWFQLGQSDCTPPQPTQHSRIVSTRPIRK